MKRCAMSLLFFALAGVPAGAHFIWIVPDGTEGTKAKVVSSEGLEPDEAVPMEKIAALRFDFLGDFEGGRSRLVLKVGAFPRESSG